MPTIGYLNSGGDCPGLNTVMDAVVASLSPTYKILGFRQGFEGLYNQDYLTLTPSFTSQYKFTGGTILKTVNKGNFAIKANLGELSPIDKQVIQHTVANYHDLGLEALVVAGGDGSLQVAKILQNYGLNIIAIPKSIDNDLQGTDFTFGFHTAIDIATEALDKLRTTGDSHNRAMILEVMGRYTGWIGLYTGLSGGADIVLIPEIKFHPENLKDYLKQSSQNSHLIITAEGCHKANGEHWTKDIYSSASEQTLGGVGDHLAAFLNQDPDIEARSTALGHIQRGGQPNSTDRLLSRLYGVQAAHLVKQKKYGQMVAYTQGQISYTDLQQATTSLKKISTHNPVLQSCQNLGIYFGE